MYNTSEERNSMAYLIAAIVSGVEDAVPEPFDYDLADKILSIIEEELNKI